VNSSNSPAKPISSLYIALTLAGDVSDGFDVRGAGEEGRLLELPVTRRLAPFNIRSLSYTSPYYCKLLNYQ